MEGIMNSLNALLAEYGLQIIRAVLFLVIGRYLAILLKKIIQRLLTKSKVEETLVSFITSLSYVAMLTIVVIAVLEELGFKTTSFVAILGAAGLAIGLAMQGSLSNFAAGVLMIIFKPFKVGDFIEAAGASGVVEEIGIFTTIIKTPDNKEIIIPNSKVTGDNIVNYSAKDTRRVDIVAGVSYSDDLDKVRTVLEQVLSEDERILKDPAPMIAVMELADSSVNLTVRSWVKTEDYWNVFFATQEKIKKRFDDEGISIPFPQQDIHLFKTDE